MIAIHTNTPLIPLTQMVQADGVIEEGGDFDRIVLVEDDLVAHFMGMTLEILGYEVIAHQVVPR
jgi:hypothetical protein